MLLLQFVIVGLRYGFSVGVPWAQDLVVYLFCISVLLPMLSVVTGNSSVRVDIFYAQMPRRWQTKIDRVALLVFLAPSFGYGAWRSLDSAVISVRLLESSPTYGGMPGLFVLKSCLAACLFLVALAALFQSLHPNPYPTSMDNT
jgi:TRAP-type mannitol/chloroaromatic compound transport system permease small subunit